MHIHLFSLKVPQHSRLYTEEKTHHKKHFNYMIILNHFPLGPSYSQYKGKCNFLTL